MRVRGDRAPGCTSGRRPGRVPSTPRIGVFAGTALVFASFFFVQTVAYGQAGYSMVRSALLPPTFYVGDRVELRLQIQPDEGRRVAPPETLPQDPWIHVDQVALSQAGSQIQVRIFFESYAPGAHSLPPIRIGEVTLAGLSVTTASLVGSGKGGLSEPKGQLFLPGTGLLLALLIGLVFGLPPLLFFSIRAIRRLLSRLARRREFERPWRRFAQALEHLQSPEALRDSRSFYILLCDELRIYLSHRAHRGFLTATAREFTPLIERSFPTLTQVRETASVMSFGDQVKFAGIVAGSDHLSKDLAMVRAAASLIEERTRQELSEAHRRPGGADVKL